MGPVIVIIRAWVSPSSQKTYWIPQIMRLTRLNYPQILLSLFLAVLLAGCSNLPMPTAFATHQAPQIVIPTGTPRPTVTITPTEVSSVMQGTPVPPPPQPISAANVANFKRLAQWGKGIPQAIAWSKDNHTVLVGTTSGLVFFDASSLAENKFVETGVGVRSVAYSPSGKQLAIGFQDGSVQVWDADYTKLLKRTDPRAYPVIALAFSADGNRLAASLWNRTVTQYELSRLFGKTPDISGGFTITGFKMPPSNLAYNTDNSLLYTFQADSPIYLMRTDKSVTRTMDVNKDGSGNPPVNGAFSPDLNWLATNYGSSIQIQRLADGVTANTLGPFSETISAVTFSPDSSLLAAASNSSINVWKSSDATAVKTFTVPNTGEPVNFLAFSWDGKSLAAFSDTLRVWQMSGDQPVAAKSGGFISGYRGAFSFTADSSGVMLAQLDGSVRVYKMPDGATQTTLNLPDLASKGMAISPDHSKVAAISGNKAYVWNASDGKQVAELDGQRAMNGNLAFSPDGKYLAAPGLDKTIVVWRMSDQTILGTVACPDVVTNLVFSPDGALLAGFSSNGAIAIFQLSDGKLRYQLSGYSLAFTANGKTMAVAFGNSDSARITLYNSADGKPIKEFATDGGSLAFSPDGKLLAVGGNSLLLLQTSDGKVLKSLANPAPYGPLAFSPDGKLIGAAGWDGCVFLWGEE